MNGNNIHHYNVFNINHKRGFLLHFNDIQTTLDKPYFLSLEVNNYVDDLL